MLAVMGWREGQGVGERLEVQAKPKKPKQPKTVKPKRKYGVALPPGHDDEGMSDDDVASTDSGGASGSDDAGPPKW